MDHRRHGTLLLATPEVQVQTATTRTERENLAVLAVGYIRLKLSAAL